MAIPRRSLRVLWAYSGKTASLSAATAIRRWLLPEIQQMDVLAVAPLEAASLKRMMRWTGKKQSPELEKAAEAATEAVTALGSTDTPIRRLTRWGAASREIALQSEESESNLIVLGTGTARPATASKLGPTALAVLFETAISLLLARPIPSEEAAPVLILHSPQSQYAKAIATLDTLALAKDVPVYLVALLPPVKSPSGMLLSFNEAVRAKEQAAHDALEKALSGRLDDTKERLSVKGWSDVRSVIRNNELRELPEIIRAFDPRLIIVGDTRGRDPARAEREAIAQMAGAASCSVLIAR